MVRLVLKIIDIPEDIILYPRDNCGRPRDKNTGREVAFDKPISEGRDGTSKTLANQIYIYPVCFDNKRLFEFIDRIEIKFDKQKSNGQTDNS